MPSGAVNDVVIFEELQDKLLFAATNIGVYGSIDAGETWERVGANMPYIPVRDMAFNMFENKLVAGTYGRSINTYDFTNALNQIDPTSTYNSEYVDVKVYPNPFVEYMVIETQANVSKMELYNVEGRKIWERNFATNINLEGLNKGIYFISLKNERGEVIAMERIVKG